MREKRERNIEIKRERERERERRFTKKLTVTKINIPTLIKFLHIHVGRACIYMMVNNPDTCKLW